MNKGDLVNYNDGHKSENGIVKEVKDDNQTFVVFNCGGDIFNYHNYTAQLCDNQYLTEGWQKLETVKDNDSNFRTFTHTEDGHNKLWQIRIDDENNRVITQYGRIGNNYTENVKEFPTDSNCWNYQDKKIKEKLRKGYKELL